MRIPGYWRIENKLTDLKLKRYQKKNNFNPLDNYLIFSDPRGGSTWITELVKEVTSSPVIWEPLAVRKMPEFKNLDFAWRQFIPEEREWPEARDLFEQVFSGQLLNHWLTMKTNIAELSAADQLLIKFCRGNQLLPWLTRQFPFRKKPVYLIRHPFAVVASQLKQGGWNSEFQRFTLHEGSNSELLAPHKTFLESLKTKEEALTATWCLCNQVPLNHARNNIDWITLNYEEIILNPEKTFHRISEEWSLALQDFDGLKFNKPSATTVSGSPVSGNSQIENWTKKLTPDQVKRMEEVLKYFDVKAYSADPYPEITYNYSQL
ncbi:MAG: hypothetical protein WBA74_18550 [Cyclobacteriaceae bacterium]